jgi:hypothetical protein
MWLGLFPALRRFDRLEDAPFPVILSVAPQARSRRTMEKICLSMTTTVAGFYAMPD